MSEPRLIEVEPSQPAPSDRHWFVPAGPDGWFCVACNLPYRNRRHAQRPGGVSVRAVVQG